MTINIIDIGKRLKNIRDFLKIINLSSNTPNAVTGPPGFEMLTLKKSENSAGVPGLYIFEYAICSESSSPANTNLFFQFTIIEALGAGSLSSTPPVVYNVGLFNKLKSDAPSVYVIVSTVLSLKVGEAYVCNR